MSSKHIDATNQVSLILAPSYHNFLATIGLSDYINFLRI